MFEYAISKGEGTLIEYGFTDESEMQSIVIDCVVMKWTLIFSDASPDCLTAQ